MCCKQHKPNTLLNKLTIITINKNNRIGLERTQNSLLQQSIQDFCWIVIDGGSSDNSLGVLKGRANTIISEEDRGIYHAMNKGITLCDDSYIWFLNSGDVLSSESVVAEVYNRLGYADVIYGDIEMIGVKINRTWISGAFQKWKLYLGWHPPHPAFICRRSLDNFGRNFLFNEAYNISADYDFMIRKIKEKRLKIIYIPRSLVKMELGGISNSSIQNILLANLQCSHAWKKFIVIPAFWLLVTKPLLKLKQIRRVK